MGTDIGFQRVALLNDQYARCIDEDLLEEWPNLFLEQCLYKVTNADNYRRKYEAGLIYANTRGMLQDRVASLRKANVYEQHRYRHVISSPAVMGQDGNTLACESEFLVIRIMRDGTLSLFATGKYIDKIVAVNGACKFAERIVVCDGGNIDALLAMPL